MKHYSFDWINTHHLQAVTRAKTPRPFPGKYPTRIAWELQLRNNGKRWVHRYIGKPSALKLKQFYELYNTYGASRWAVEFDKNGILARLGTGTLPGISSLREVYHPDPADYTTFFALPGRWETQKGRRVFVTTPVPVPEPPAAVTYTTVGGMDWFTPATLDALQGERQRAQAEVAMQEIMQDRPAAPPAPRPTQVRPTFAPMFGRRNVQG